MKTGFAAAEKLAEEVNAQKEQQKDKEPRYEYELFKTPKNAEPQRVRFIVADEDDSIVTVVEHWVLLNNGWNKNFLCPNEEPNDDKCIACRGKKGETFQTNQKSVKHIINLIDRSDNKIKVWKFSPMAFAALKEHYDENGNIFDRDYTIQFLETTDTALKSSFIFKVESVTDEPSPLTKAEKALIENRYDLTKCVTNYDEDHLKWAFALTPKKKESTQS